MSTRLMFVHSLSPLHAGTGQSSGAIELAIARDRTTGLPYLPSSSIKGTLRSRARSAWKPDEVFAVFGPDTANASDHAGALVVGDANLLLLPVRSIAGTFAWVTSPYVLRRFMRDCEEAGLTSLRIPRLPATPDRCCVGHESKLIADDRVIFEDLDFTPSKDPGVAQLADALGALLFPDEDTKGTWRQLLQDKLCIVHDDVMSFLSQHATDVVARVALKDDTKTVDQLWHEENLPTEAVLVSLVGAAPNAKTGLNRGQILEKLESLGSTPLQFGGNATIGRGRCRVTFAGGEA